MNASGTKIRDLSATLLCTACLGAGAQEFDYISDGRIVVGFGYVEYLNGTNEAGSQQDEPFDLYSSWGSSVGDGTSVSGGGASLTSSLTGTEIVASGDASALAMFDMNKHSISSGLGASTFGISFRFDDATLVNVNGMIEAAGVARSWLRLQDRNTGSMFLDLFTDAGTEVLTDQQLLLPAGDYSFSMYAESNITLEADGNASGAASYEGSIAIVPSPAGLAVLLPAGVLAARRRR